MYKKHDVICTKNGTFVKTAVQKKRQNMNFMYFNSAQIADERHNQLKLYTFVCKSWYKEYKVCGWRVLSLLKSKKRKLFLQEKVKKLKTSSNF